MNAGRRPIDWLVDAREYARKARQMAFDANREELNERDYLAVRYCLVVLGEALDRVPDETLALEAAIPWRQVIALRHRLVHGFWLIDKDIIMEIAQNEMEPLLAALDRIVDRLS